MDLCRVVFASTICTEDREKDSFMGVLFENFFTRFINAEKPG